MDDVFTRILDLTSYLSSPLLHLLGEFFGTLVFIYDAIMCSWIAFSNELLIHAISVY